MDKLTLSPTSIRDFYNCQRRWYFIRVAKIKVPRVGRVILGRSYHDAIAYAYRQKKLGIIPRVDSILQIYDISWRNQVDYDDTEILWYDDSPDELFNAGRQLISMYINNILPRYTPIDVEGRRSVFLDDKSEIELVGYPDVICSSGDDIVIIDHKIRKRRMSQYEVDNDYQLSAYGLMLDRPVKCEMHCALIRKTLDIDIVQSSRCDEHYRWLRESIIDTWNVIKRAKEFLPNPSWIFCKPPNNKGGCEVWDICHS